MSSLDWAGLIAKLESGLDLEPREAQSAMREVLEDRADKEILKTFLLALKNKGETPEEVGALVEQMYQFCSPISITERAVDTVGTGGDGAHTINISTTAAIIAAAAGSRVVKHGNRAASSKSGAGDLLEALGVAINLDGEKVAKTVSELGIGFCFAPVFHPAMRFAAPARKELATATVFNILGPLTNPAKAPNIVMGVFHPELVVTQAKVLQLMGAEHALVVHGNDGLDEITLSGPTMVAELRNGQISQYEIKPSDFGIANASMENLKVADAQESKAIILNIMNNQSGPARDVVCLNAGATLYAANVSPSIAEGIALANSTIASGKAKQKLEAFVALTQSLAS